MKLSPIVFALRLGDTYFKSFVGGAADFGNIQINSFNKETAFVIPLGEDATANDCDGSVNQMITERFGVVCVLKNDTSSAEKTGILAYDKLHDIRNDLFRILINLDLGYATVIEYAGAQLLELNQAWLWYQFEFLYKTRIFAGQGGWGEIEESDIEARQDPIQLPDFNTIYTDYLLSPSEHLPYTGILPLAASVRDAAQQVDTDDDPNPGDFDAGFSRAFKILLKNQVRR